MWRDFPMGATGGASGSKRVQKVARRLRCGRSPLALARYFRGQSSLTNPLLQILSATPIKTRFVRILMNKSSGSAATGAKDIRDTLGFALREIYLGAVNDKGEFHDEIQHGKDHSKQTLMHVSSTDPWHRETDLDEGVEQPGFDRIFQSGLTNDLPVLLRREFSLYARERG